MPFYIRPRGKRRYTRPVLWGAGVMLAWTVFRVATVSTDPSIARPGFLGNLLYIVLLTALGGAIVGGFYWTLDLPQLRRNQAVRILVATLCAALYFVTFSLAATRFTSIRLLDRITQSDFLLGTALLSLIAGFVIGKDLFGLAGLTERIYLSPADYKALAPHLQAELQPEDGGKSDPSAPN